MRRDLAQRLRDKLTRRSVVVARERDANHGQRPSQAGGPFGDQRHDFANQRENLGAERLDAGRGRHGRVDQLLLLLLLLVKVNVAVAVFVVGIVAAAALVAVRRLGRGQIRRLVGGAQRREREQAVEEDGLLEESAQQAGLGLVGHAVRLLPVGDGEVGNVVVDLARGGADESPDGGAGGDEGAQAVNADEVRKDVARARDVRVERKREDVVYFLGGEVVEYGQHVRRGRGGARQYMEPAGVVRSFVPHWPSMFGNSVGEGGVAYMKTY